jgi:hypothetical protein
MSASKREGGSGAQAKDQKCPKHGVSKRNVVLLG